MLSLPPWASKSNALTKYKLSTTMGINMPGPVVKDPHLNVTGVRLLWAAITSGRPPGLVPTVFDSSNAAYRQWRIWASLGMIEPDGSGGLQRTLSFDELDPTEKGHLNYALAGALTKAYAGAKLDSPWLAHLSLAKSTSYTIQFATTGKTQPDYFGVTYAGDFIVGEAKGRITVNAGLKGQLDNKQQTGAISHISASPSGAPASPVARYGIAVATGGKNIKLYATDPPEEATGLPDPDEWIRAYYRYLLQLEELVNAADEDDPFARGQDGFEWQSVRFVVPDTARRWANGEGSPLADWFNPGSQLVDNLQRDIPVLGLNPDRTYFTAR